MVGTANLSETSRNGAAAARETAQSQHESVLRTGRMGQKVEVRCRRSEASLSGAASALEQKVEVRCRRSEASLSGAASALEQKVEVRRRRSEANLSGAASALEKKA
jgi:hypothetical protein